MIPVHRNCVLSIAALMLLASHGSAQQTDDLDAVLHAWEKATREVKSVSCVLTRETVDKARASKTTENGLALFLRARGPDDLSHFRIELTSVSKPAESQKFIGGGKFLYSYEPADKVVRVFHLAPFKKAVLDRISLLSFIFEMDAEHAKERYEIQLINPGVPDESYQYLRVRPKSENDKRDFSEARISVIRNINLPAYIWSREPGGREITWTFSSVDINSDKIVPALFNPQVPEGWRLERPSAPR